MTEITVKVQLNSAEETRNFLSSLLLASCSCSYAPCGVTEQPAPEQPEPEQPEPEQPAPEQPAPEQPAPEQPAPEQPKAPAKSKKAYKAEDVRAAMASKLSTHRLEMVDKLKELGAKNVSSLSEDKYEDFINFCNSL